MKSKDSKSKKHDLENRQKLFKNIIKETPQSEEPTDEQKEWVLSKLRKGRRSWEAFKE